MYKTTFGKFQQISFNSEAEYYEFLGYLSKNKGATRLVWEKNNEQGAYGPEGRIEFFEEQPDDLRAKLTHTAGTGNILSRVNCNEFLENIKINHNFVLGLTQDTANIKATVPSKFYNDFDGGLLL